MVVDFEVTRTPSYTVASIVKIGPYGEDNLGSEFGELVSGAKKNRLRTGKWIMYEHDGPNSRRPGNQRRWEACLEIRGKAKAEGRIRIKKLPAQAVAHVVFNPNVVSSRIIYHGLGDWIWWRLKYKDFKRAGPTREAPARAATRSIFSRGGSSNKPPSRALTKTWTRRSVSPSNRWTGIVVSEWIRSSWSRARWESTSTCPVFLTSATNRRRAAIVGETTRYVSQPPK